MPQRHLADRVVVNAAAIGAVHGHCPIDVAQAATTALIAFAGTHVRAHAIAAALLAVLSQCEARITVRVLCINENQIGLRAHATARKRCTVDAIVHSNVSDFPAVNSHIDVAGGNAAAVIVVGEGRRAPAEIALNFS